MQVTDDIRILLEKRRLAGEEAIAYESEVISWCNKHGIKTDDITYFNGCMLVTEPGTYERLFLERIEETETKEKQ